MYSFRIPCKKPFFIFSNTHTSNKDTEEYADPDMGFGSGKVDGLDVDEEV